MSSREQYKELHKRQRAAIRDLNLAVEKIQQYAGTLPDEDLINGYKKIGLLQACLIIQDLRDELTKEICQEK